MKKPVLAIAAALVLVPVLAACSSAADSDPKPSAAPTQNSTKVETADLSDDLPQWEKELRVGVNIGFDSLGEEGFAQACEGYEMMGVESPQAMADLLAPYADDLGITEQMALIPDSVDVSVEDVLLITAEEMFERCGF